MPIYEYLCQKCGQHLEVMQKMSDKPLSRCPKCRGKLEKKFSQTSFQLKGSGWYATDYATSGKRSKSESETADKQDKSKKTDGDAGSKSPKKGETSPATSGVTGSGGKSGAKSDE